MLGISKNALSIRSPFEQIARVDCMRSLPNSNAILLHIFSPVQFNRHVLPILLPQRYVPYFVYKFFQINCSWTFFSAAILSADLECFALSHDSKGGLQKVQVEKSSDEYEIDQRCFRNSSTADFLQCGGYFAANYGAVVCKIRSQPTSYFPVSFFKKSNGLCAFSNNSTLHTLQNIYSDIRKIRGKQKVSLDKISI